MMKNFLFIFFLCFINFTLIVHCALTGAAQFGVGPIKHGITGIIEALNGYININIDVSGVNWNQFPIVNCSTNGLLYHIHSKWMYDDTDSSKAQDRILDECHYNFTGNHYDPWYACGPNSDNKDCKNNGGCIESSTIWGNSYNPNHNYICTHSKNESDYNIVPYTCEVGDWSGKYGVLNGSTMNNGVTKRTDQSFWEVDKAVLSPNTNVLAKYSMVIHCTDIKKTRAFCAPILRANTAFSAVALTGDQTIKAKVDILGYTAFDITISDTGMVFNIPNDIGNECNNWYLYLYAKWNDNNLDSKLNCDLNQLGGIYDPTHSCINSSSSIYCSDNGIRCKSSSNTQVQYQCDGNLNRYNCAVGDISGRVGLISNGAQIINDILSPPLWVLGNKVLVFKCMDKVLNGKIDNICALTKQTNGTINTLNPDNESNVDSIYYYNNNINIFYLLMMIIYYMLLCSVIV